MTKHLQDILDRVKRWPAHRQQDVARVIERMEEIGVEVYRLSDEERELIDEGLASEIVSNENMEQFWNRHRL